MRPSDQLDLLESACRVAPFAERLRSTLAFPLHSTGIEVLQMNVGRRCNMACKHCHVDAGPQHPEVMPRRIFQRCLTVAREGGIGTIDITGGAPEMNPVLREFITAAASPDRRLIVRTNLTILLEDGFRDYIDLYARNGVELVASFPDTHAAKADRLRGKGSFERSVTVLRMLNERGYGREGTGLVLDLMHNAAGAYIPAPQSALEGQYRERLLNDHGVFFSRLFCLTNCPVGRYLEFLTRTDNLCDYMHELSRAYNPAAARNVMCRTTLSVGWDGTLYDCDFNQMLQLPVNHGAPSHIDAFDLEKLRNREIVVNNHCYACTAGAGSSCQGSLEDGSLSA
ncbi:MAG: arsenosugar biosynthesis radical SAM protein ArsS [Desulfobacteraceae bacterium]|nr:arsenosugar biosynthesis radical SAM protein ArsS [Desulfobacteraceae bacterium]